MLAPPNIPEPLHMTEAEYLVFEAQNESKHEFANGDVFAMTGASVRHNLIVNNVVTALVNQLSEKDCIVPSSDTRVKVESKISYRYPDVMVICDKIQYVDERVDTISNPVVIVEVLSPTTALVDRNQKLDEYTQLPSVQEYVLISQDEYKLERFLRQDDANWLYTKVSGLEGILDLPSIGCQLTAQAVYAKLDLLGDTSESD